MISPSKLPRADQPDLLTVWLWGGQDTAQRYPRGYLPPKRQHALASGNREMTPVGAEGLSEVWKKKRETSDNNVKIK